MNLTANRVQILSILSIRGETAAEGEDKLMRERETMSRVRKEIHKSFGQVVRPCLDIWPRGGWR